MGKKDIKIGETYYVRVKVTAKSENRYVCRPLLLDGTMSEFAPNFFNYAEAEAFYKSIPGQPKSDPCREFRKGDRVRVVERNGRIPICFPIDRITVGDIVTVAENETGDVFIKVLSKDGHEMMAPWFMLELVTPVEELAPYIISEGAGIIEVYNEKREAVKAWFYDDVKAGVKALAEAEAERDRLNAEWRKEMGK